MTDPNTDPREAPPPVDLRPHVVAYLANNLRTNGYEHHARTMEALAALHAAGEPVAWQFYQGGKWRSGDDRIKDHRKNTEEAGYAVRDLYAAPQASASGHTPEALDTGSGHSATQAGVETAKVRRNTLLSVLGRLNSNPYNLTKSECIDVVRSMFDDADKALKSAPAAEDSAKGAGDVALPPLPKATCDHTTGHAAIRKDADILAYGFACYQEGRQQSGGNMDEREAFEAWKTERLATGKGFDAFDIWRARAALAAHKPDGGDADYTKRLETCLLDCNTVALMRGDMYLSDCIDNAGTRYQSQALGDLIAMAQQRQEGK